MSAPDTSAPGAAGPGRGGERIVIVAVIVLALAALWYLSSQRQTTLRVSASGFDGLTTWLRANDLDAQTFTGGYSIDAKTVGLAVLPIYDTRPGEARKRPNTKEELIFQKDENTVFALPLRVRMVPSLLALPKWRTGMRLTGVGHPALLIPGAENNVILPDILSGGTVTHIPQPFTRFPYEASDGRRLEAELYVAQVFRSPDCRPIIGTRDAMVLGECVLPDIPEGLERSFRRNDPQETVLILSDPDLLSNHGMRLGDNAEIALDLISSRAAAARAPAEDAEDTASSDGRVFVDYSPYSRFVFFRSRGADRERTWSDLLRFFEYPFSILWVGAGLAFGLAVWRGGLRFGPLPAVPTGPGSGGQLAIAAQARLLRLTGQDGAILSDYAAARLAAVANARFGPAAARAGGGAETAILRHLRRKDPPTGAALEDALERIRALPPAIPATEAIAHVDAFEKILEKIDHDT